MKKWLLVCSIFLLLVGCGEHANPSAPKSPSNETQAAPNDSSPPETSLSSNETQAASDNSPPGTSQSSNENKTRTDPSDSSPSEKSSSIPEEEEMEPVYIDESQYEGDELIFVQLINHSVRFINEENEEGYMSLLASNSVVTAMPKRKISKVELVSIGEPNGSHIAVSVNYWRNEEEQSRMYVFTKENNEWKILDID